MGEYTSITFNTDKTVSDISAQDLTKQVVTNGWGDGSSAGIRINTGGRVTANVGQDGEVVATHHARTNSINMGTIPNGEQGLLSSLTRNGAVISASQAHGDDFVTLPGGIVTTLANAERLGFVQHDKAAGRYENVGEARLREATGEAEQERRAAAAQAAQAADAERERINRHPDEQIEAATQSFANSVQTSDQIALLVQMNRDGKPMPSTLHRVAEQMGMTPEQATDSLNAMAMGTQAQLRVLAKAREVDADAFADWTRTHRSGQVQQALQRHVLHRDVVGAWDGLIGEYKRATQGANRG